MLIKDKKIADLKEIKESEIPTANSNSNSNSTSISISTSVEADTSQLSDSKLELKFTDADKQYLDYITEHKWNVMRAYNRLLECQDVLNLTDELLEDVKSDVIDHDVTKYSTDEFEAYRDKFTLKLEGVNIEEAFDQAWEHHYNTNPHHPEYWAGPTTAESRCMPRSAIIGMCLDFYAMSLKFKDSSHTYFINKKEKLAKETPFLVDSFEFIEKILAALNDVVTTNTEKVEEVRSDES